MDTQTQPERVGYQLQSPPPPTEQETILRALPRLIRRRALVILVPLLVVPAVAVLLANKQPKEYSAVASIVFRDTQGLASADPAREAATNVGVLETGVIADAAKKKLGLSNGDVTFTSSPDSNLVNVKATARSPKNSARLANAVARGYIAYRLSATKDQLGAEEQRIRAELPTINGHDKVSKAQRSTLRRRLRALTLESATLTPEAQQVGRATPPSGPSAPHPMRSGIIGGAVGLLIGLLIALALERLDLRVLDPRHFEQVFGRPILGRIPRSRALSKTPPGKDLPPVEGQAFADLRANLRHHVGSPNGHAKSLVVTSAEAAEGKTTVAWHLACAAATPHQRVLVIEADLRRPGLSAKLGTDGTPGLSEVLLGRASMEQATRQIPIGPRENGNGNGNGHGRRRARTVDVLFAGSPANDPTSLLESPEMQTLLEHAKEAYDLVIIDTPPTTIAKDAVPLVSSASGVLVVGRLAKSHVGPVADLSKQLREIDAPMVGVVVNSTEVPRNMYDYYYARPRF